jgi:putative membrane protein
VERAIEFHFVPEITVGVVVLVGGYLYAVSPLNPEQRARVGRWRIAAFLLGALTYFIALHPPIATLAEDWLFSVHMVQHVLVTLVGPPLLIVGTPGWLLAPVVRVRWVRRAGRALTRLPVAFAIGQGTFWIWHLPTIYELTLQDRAVHDLAHIAMMAGAVVMWWPVLSPTSAVPQAPRPLQALYLFLLSLPSGFLSALLVFAEEPLYPTYELAARVIEISALQDQRIGGLIMKLGGTLILWSVLSVYFFRMMHATPRRGPMERSTAR